MNQTPCIHTNGASDFDPFPSRGSFTCIAYQMKQNMSVSRLVCMTHRILKAKHAYGYLVGGFKHLEKYEFVNGKDYQPYNII